MATATTRVPFEDALERLWIANEATRKAREALDKAGEELEAALKAAAGSDDPEIGDEVQSIGMLNGYRAEAKLVAADCHDQEGDYYIEQIAELVRMGEMVFTGIPERKAA